MQFMKIPAISISIMLLLFGCVPKQSTNVQNVQLSDNQPQIVKCQPIEAPESCELINSYDKNKSLWIFGNVLTQNQIYENGGVEIGSDGTIKQVGCIAPPKDAAILNCPSHVISPGLINAHDHLKYNHNFPGGQNNTDEQGNITNPDYAFCNDPDNAYKEEKCKNYRYDRRNEWRKGLEGKPMILAHSDAWPNTPDAKADEYKKIVWNELRHIMAGTTTVAGSGGYHGLVRNPDEVTMMEGLKIQDGKKVFYNTFPLGDTSDVTGLDYGNCRYPKVVTTAVLDNLVFLPHVAEGINAYAHNELKCLSGNGVGSVNVEAANSTFIHAIAANPKDAKDIKDAGMTLVWSPRSNISLYGNTAQVVMYDYLSIPIALATDWTPSGSINMFRELACANEMNARYFNSHFSKYDLWKMVTINAAHALGIDDQVGDIKQGYWADIAIHKMDDSETSYFDPVIFGTTQGVFLVLRGGVPMYGDTKLIKALSSDYHVLPPEQSYADKAVCLGEIKQANPDFDFDDFLKVNASSYPLTFPANKRIEDEPSCVPARYQEYSGGILLDDMDGDGIADQKDNCREIFNPVRPMDNGKQADYDNDGIGDACDPNPLK